MRNAQVVFKFETLHSYYSSGPFHIFLSILSSHGISFNIETSDDSKLMPEYHYFIYSFAYIQLEDFTRILPALLRSIDCENSGVFRDHLI